MKQLDRLKASLKNSNSGEEVVRKINNKFTPDTTERDEAIRKAEEAERERRRQINSEKAKNKASKKSPSKRSGSQRLVKEPEKIHDEEIMNFESKDDDYSDLQEVRRVRYHEDKDSEDVAEDGLDGLEEGLEDDLDDNNDAGSSDNPEDTSEQTLENSEPLDEHSHVQDSDNLRNESDDLKEPEDSQLQEEKSVVQEVPLEEIPSVEEEIVPEDELPDAKYSDKFTIVSNGYSVTQVDAFLNEMDKKIPLFGRELNDVEMLEIDNGLLREEISRLKRKLGGSSETDERFIDFRSTIGKRNGF